MSVDKHNGCIPPKDTCPGNKTQSLLRNTDASAIPAGRYYYQNKKAGESTFICCHSFVNKIKTSRDEKFLRFCCNTSVSISHPTARLCRKALRQKHQAVHQADRPIIPWKTCSHTGIQCFSSTKSSLWTVPGLKR